ncbi:hypothetical protein V6R21_20655 [Limibacter armeniacum]|uniref:hypothetical protein n=1 Tax=Limibacter armeniacum TaxID=466084 RepID=UPI002FE5BBAE
MDYYNDDLSDKCKAIKELCEEESENEAKKAEGEKEIDKEQDELFILTNSQFLLSNIAKMLKVQFYHQSNSDQDVVYEVHCPPPEQLS